MQRINYISPTPASLETAQLATEKLYYSGEDSGRVNKSTVAGYPQWRRYAAKEMLRWRICANHIDWSFIKPFLIFIDE